MSENKPWLVGEVGTNLPVVNLNEVKVIAAQGRKEIVFHFSDTLCATWAFDTWDERNNAYEALIFSELKCIVADKRRL